MPTPDLELYRNVLEGLHTGVYVMDRSGKILFWNDGAERITGYLRQDMMGRVSQSNFLGQTDSDGNELAGVQSPISLALRDGKPVGKQVSLCHKAGHRVPVHLHAFPIRDAHGAILAAAESFEESVSVAEWDRRQDKLATYGCLDPASGVLNHAVILSHLREALGVFAEHHVPFSVLCIEIDQLEQIKMRDGPGATASVLRVVGQSLENSLRPTDFLGRWQNNQFFAILTECGIVELPLVGGRLRRMAATSKVEWWGDSLKVSVCLGGTVVRTGDTVESLTLRAEAALRASITQGGACITVASE
jgi:PAS domain S-box-containing protein/diguanylate cyclase (GGDEF)-like protein